MPVIPTWAIIVAFALAAIEVAYGVYFLTRAPWAGSANGHCGVDVDDDEADDDDDDRTCCFTQDPDRPWVDANEGSHSALDDFPMGYINPASGLPMIPGSSIDVAGNLFGCDFHHHSHP